MVLKGRFTGPHMFYDFRRGCIYMLSVEEVKQTEKTGFFTKEITSIISVKCKGHREVKYSNPIRAMLDWNFSATKATKL